MADHTTIILHHYDTSPFSEKIRLILGLKGVAWASVKIPHMMPKPDLMPLTGGYRKTPVLQIGADIFCDSAMIARELERRVPTPTLFPGGNRGLMWSVGKWTDGPVFQASVAIIFGSLADQIPEDFIRDRQDFAGQRFDLEAMRRAVPAMRDQWRAAMGWVEAQLQDGRPFLVGEQAGLGDISCYMNVWFIRNAFPPAAVILDEFPLVKAWADRVAGFGHGTSEALSSADALEIARAADPATPRRADPYDPNGLEPGDAVAVAPDDTGRVPVHGTIVALSAQHIAIERTDPRAGRLVVHFPRSGFHIMRL
ncbi:MAG: glutathione S-transferase family protein [Alphaproteobacteria bacterium]